MMVSGNLNAHEIESLMDSEIETHHAEAHGPVNALGRLAGALPAFGIVAAVLGVVNTMGSVGQPPAILGGMIGSALVGTFLGILLAYAVVEPLGGLIEAEGRRRLEGELAVHQDDAARVDAGLRAASRGRVRPQGAVFEGPAHVLRARRPRQGQEGVITAVVDRAGSQRQGGLFLLHVPRGEPGYSSSPPNTRAKQAALPLRSCTERRRERVRAARFGRGWRAADFRKC